MLLEKGKIRKVIRAINEKSALTERKIWDDRIAASLISFPIVADAQTVCIYVSLPEEVDTGKIMEELFRQKKTVIVPKIFPHKRLKLFQIQSLTDLEPGVFNIPEPGLTCTEIDSSVIDLFIIPGVAFDRYGYRLGRGMGYYDRLLIDTWIPKIGLSYSFQLIPRLPHAPYDIPMDVIVTEKEIIRIKN